MKSENNDKKDKAGKPEDSGFPGHPIYPADEDIMNQKSGYKKKSLENDLTDINPDGSLIEKPMLPEDELREQKKDAFYTDDLNPNAGGEDDELRERVWEVDMAGYDLDVPGADLDDDEEAIIGEEDEENNLYSTTDDYDNEEEN